MKLRDIPNALTVARILLTVPAIALLSLRHYSATLILLAIAGVSDALDGYLAKRFGWTSRFGALADPLADKFLLVASFFTLGWLGLIPWWLVGLVILRDVVIVAGALTYHFQVSELRADPTPISKLNTSAQIVLVVLVVADAGPLPLPDWVIPGLMGLTAITTVWSGADYVWVWARRAMSQGWLRKR